MDEKKPEVSGNDTMRISAEFPSLGNASALPPGLFGAGTYSNITQGKYSDSDFPQLQGPPPDIFEEDEEPRYSLVVFFNCNNLLISSFFI